MRGPFLGSPFLEGARILIGAVMDEDQVAEGDPVDLVVQELHATIAKRKVSTTWMAAGKYPRIGSVRRLPQIRMRIVIRLIDVVSEI